MLIKLEKTQKFYDFAVLIFSQNLKVMQIPLEPNQEDSKQSKTDLQLETTLRSALYTTGTALFLRRQTFEPTCLVLKWQE